MSREAPNPEVVARAILRELNDVMKSPRGDYYQGDIADPHRTRHIIERHVEAYGKAIAERAAEIAQGHVEQQAFTDTGRMWRSTAAQAIADELRATLP